MRPQAADRIRINGPNDIVESPPGTWRELTRDSCVALRRSNDLGGTLAAPWPQGVNRNGAPRPGNMLRRTLSRFEKWCFSAPATVRVGLVHPVLADDVLRLVVLLVAVPIDLPDPPVFPDAVRGLVMLHEDDRG
jgi:hypothetical protein